MIMMLEVVRSFTTKKEFQIIVCDRPIQTRARHNENSQTRIVALFLSRHAETMKNDPKRSWGITYNTHTDTHAYHNIQRKSHLIRILDIPRTDIKNRDSRRARHVRMRQNLHVRACGGRFEFPMSRPRKPENLRNGNRPPSTTALAKVICAQTRMI